MSFHNTALMKLALLTVSAHNLFASIAGTKVTDMENIIRLDPVVLLP
jgi:hypothetical protein